MQFKWLSKSAKMNRVIIWLVALQVTSAVPREFANYRHGLSPDQVPVEVDTDIRNIVSSLPQKLKKEILETTRKNPNKRFNLDTGQYESTTTDGPSNFVINKNDKRYRIKLTKKPGSGVERHSGNNTSIHITNRTHYETAFRPSDNGPSTYRILRLNGSSAVSSKHTSTSRPSDTESSTYRHEAITNTAKKDATEIATNKNSYSLSQNYRSAQRLKSDNVNNEMVKPKQKFRITTHRTITTTHRKISSTKPVKSVEEIEEEKVINDICKTLNIAPKDVRTFIKKYYNLDISKEEDFEELKNAYDDFMLKVSQNPKLKNPKSYKDLLLQELNNSKSIESNEVLNNFTSIKVSSSSKSIDINTLSKNSVNSPKDVNDTKTLIEDLTHFLKPLIDISPNETEKLLQKLTSPLDTTNGSVYKLANNGVIRVEKTENEESDERNGENIERYIIKTTASSQEQLPPPIVIDEATASSQEQLPPPIVIDEATASSQEQLPPPIVIDEDIHETAPYDSNKNESSLETSLSENESKNNNLALNEYTGESSIESNESYDSKTMGEPYDIDRFFADSEQSSKDETNDVKALFGIHDNSTEGTELPVLPLRTAQQHTKLQVKNQTHSTLIRPIIRKPGRSYTENLETSVIALPSTVDSDIADLGVITLETSTKNPDKTATSATTEINLTTNLQETNEGAQTEKSSVTNAATAPSITTDIYLTEKLPQTNEDAHAKEETKTEYIDTTTTEPFVVNPSNNYVTTNRNAGIEESSPQSELLTTTNFFKEHEIDDSLTVLIPDPISLTTTPGTVEEGTGPKYEISSTEPTLTSLTTEATSASSTEKNPNQTGHEPTFSADSDDSKDVLETTEEKLSTYVLNLINQVIEKVKKPQPVKGMIKEDILTSILDKQLPVFIMQAKQNNPDIDERQIHIETLIELIRRFPYMVMIILDRINKFNQPRELVDNEQQKDFFKIKDASPFNLNVRIEDELLILKLVQYLTASHLQSHAQIKSAINKITHLNKGSGVIDVTIQGSLPLSLVTKIFDAPNINMFNSAIEERDQHLPSYNVLFHKIPQILNKIVETRPNIVKIDVYEELVKIFSKAYPDINEIYNIYASRIKEILSKGFKMPESGNIFKLINKSHNQNPPEVKQRYPHKDVPGIFLQPDFQQPNNLPDQKYNEPSIVSEIEYSQIIKLPIKQKQTKLIPEHKNTILTNMKQLSRSTTAPKYKKMMRPHDQQYLLVTPKTTEDFYPKYENDQEYLVVTPKNIIHSYPKYRFLDNMKVNKDLAKLAVQKSPPLKAFVADDEIIPYYKNKPVSDQFLKVPKYSQPSKINEASNLLVRAFRGKPFLRTYTEIGTEDGEILQQDENNLLSNDQLDDSYSQEPDISQETNTLEHINPYNFIKIIDPSYDFVTNNPIITEYDDNSEQSYSNKLKENESSENSESKPQFNKGDENSESFGSNESKIIKENDNPEYNDDNKLKLTKEVNLGYMESREAKIINNNENLSYSVTNETSISEHSDTSTPQIVQENNTNKTNPEYLIEQQNKTDPNTGFDYYDTTVTNIGQKANVSVANLEPLIYNNNYESTTQDSSITSVNHEPYLIEEKQANKNVKSHENFGGPISPIDASLVHFKSNVTEIHSIPKSLKANVDDSELQINDSVDHTAIDELKYNRVIQPDSIDSDIEKQNYEQSKSNFGWKPNITEVYSDDVLGEHRSGLGSSEVYDPNVSDKIKSPIVEINNSSDSFVVEESPNDLVEEKPTKIGLDNSQIELLLDLPSDDLANHYENLTKNVLKSSLGKLRKYLKAYSVPDDVILRTEDAIREDIQELFLNADGACPDAQFKNFLKKLINAIKERVEKIYFVDET